jgi:hypothetical protein
MVIVLLVLSKVNFLMGLCFQVTIDELERGRSSLISYRKVTHLEDFSTCLWKPHFGVSFREFMSQNGSDRALSARILGFGLPNRRLGCLESDLAMSPVAKWLRDAAAAPAK